MATGSPTVRRRRLGSELKRLREEAGKSRDEVAGVLGMSVPTISRIEAGRTGVRLFVVRAMLDLYGVADEGLREELEGHARAGSRQGWWSQYASAVNSGYATYIGLEADAREVRDYEALVVPGLLQTEAYARATVQPVGLPDLPGDVVEQRVRVRMERQQRLRGEAPLEIRAIIDEAVIRRVVGGRHVMREQLKRLAEEARRPNVRLQVVPFAGGAEWPGMIGSFTILSFPEHADPDVVYVEGLTGDTFVEGDATARYSVLFDGLSAAGASYAESLRMIEEAAEALA
ncbi:helix-turn-helix domain-containing protein [Planosporangium thailandense]|uniref:Helix-turn-helix domain-containing protein n=1 Tax=Planosporangium thailandense TaxID=765197 RepID=A0ABX0XQC6_9ACTN|nr:helix-turn-helix transcriptional regulator [Planosporangium thailandense]NJC68175.1 helix-turn-helix domain-containing protein [Planosporangium thailandense]